MLRLLREHALFFICLSILLLTAAAFLLAGQDKEVVQFFNGLNKPALDVFFALYTNEGDGWIFVLFILVLLFVRYKYVIAALSSFLLTTLFVQLGKHLIFPEAKRPFSYFIGPDDLHRVPGVVIHINHSFPSGHTATAFAMFTLLVLMTNKKWMHLLFLLMAALVGISRMYLGQHYLSDVTAGALVGTFVSVLSYYIFCERYKPQWGEGFITKNL